jgi:class I fructose-bisphosphate aldolase
VVQTAGGDPVLVRGGSRAPEREILERTAQLLEQGATGIVYGRNIIQHDRPAAITRALMSILHEGASPEQAFAELQSA